MAVDVEALERRVTALESDVRGEAVLTRRLFEHVREIRDDIAILRKHAATSGDELEQIKIRLGRLDELDQIKARLGRLEHDFDTFRRDFPHQIADIMREVLKEQRGTA